MAVMWLIRTMCIKDGRYPVAILHGGHHNHRVIMLTIREEESRRGLMVMHKTILVQHQSTHRRPNHSALHMRKCTMILTHNAMIPTRTTTMRTIIMHSMTRMRMTMMDNNTQSRDIMDNMGAGAGTSPMPCSDSSHIGSRRLCVRFYCWTYFICFKLLSMVFYFYDFQIFLVLPNSSLLTIEDCCAHKFIANESKA